MTSAAGSLHYVLSCSCGATGTAEYWRADGWSLSGRKAWGLNVSCGFVRGPESIHGRPLLCRACGANAEITLVDYQQFHLSNCPEMRPVAGGSCELPPHTIINNTDVAPADGLFPDCWHKPGE